MSPSLRDRLESRTREAHEALVGLPAAAALRQGTLPVEALGTLLRAMHAVWASVEDLLGGVTDRRVEPFRREGLQRSRLVAHDLEAIGAARLRGSALAEVRAQLLAHAIRNMDSSGPGAVVGCLHALEGWLRGGRVQSPGTPEATDGLALSFFLQDGERGYSVWPSLVEWLDGSPWSEAEMVAAVEASLAVFEGLLGVLGAVHPEPDRTSWFPARELNPEAGTHRITGDPSELEAALRAGERSWRAAPYYAARYGARGRAFTRSDSAWLVTLSRVPQSRAIEHVLWLGHLLAARGMPLLLLERHLGVLHEELTARGASAPGDPYANFHAAAQTLRELRVRFLGDDVLAFAEERFERHLPAREIRISGTGTLLAAAVADDRAGVVGALESVEGWFIDPERFSEPWAENVRQLLAWAAERVGGFVER